MPRRIPYPALRTPVVSPLRDWLKVHPLVERFFVHRVYASRWPALRAGAKPQLPALLVAKAGGGMDTPLEQSMIDLTVWSSQGSEAEALAMRVVAAFESAPYPLAISDEVQLDGLVSYTVAEIPFPPTYRYRATVSLVSRALVPLV